MPDTFFDYCAFLDDPENTDSKTNVGHVLAETFSSDMTTEQIQAAVNAYYRNERDTNTTVMLVSKRAQQTARRALTEQLHTKMQTLAERLQTLRGQRSDNRSLLPEEVILASREPGSDAYEQEWAELSQAPEEDTPERAEYDRRIGAKFAASFRAMTQDLTPARIETMSDAEVVDNFGRLVLLARLRRQNALSACIPEEEQAYIQDYLERCSRPLDTAMQRVQIISSPYYMAVYPDRFPPMAPESLEKDGFNYDDLAAFAYGDEPDSGLTGSSKQSLEGYCRLCQDNSYTTLWREKCAVINALGMHDGSPVWSDGDNGRYMGVEQVPDRIMDRLYDGGTVYAKTSDNTVTAISGRLEQDGTLSLATQPSSLEEMLGVDCRGMQHQMNHYDKLLSKAHPWYCFSSDQYKQMRSAFAAVQKGLKRMGAASTPEQRAAMKEKLDALSQKCQDYIDYKNSRAMSANDQARCDVAAELKAAVADFQVSFKALDQRDRAPEEPYRAAHEAKRAAHEAWQEKNQQEMEQHLDKINRSRHINPDAGEAEGSHELSQLHAKAESWKKLQTPSSDCGNAMADLKELVVAEMPGLVDAAALESLGSQQQERLTHNMAAIVALSMIVQERGVAFSGKADSLEQLCAKNQDDFIRMVEKSSPFQKATENMTPQWVEQFLTQDGAQKIAQEIFRLVKVKQQEAKQQEPPVRQTSQRQNTQEPPQRH